MGNLQRQGALIRAQLQGERRSAVWSSARRAKHNVVEAALLLVLGCDLVEVDQRFEKLLGALLSLQSHLGCLQACMRWFDRRLAPTSNASTLPSNPSSWTATCFTCSLAYGRSIRPLMQESKALACRRTLEGFELGIAAMSGSANDCTRFWRLLSTAGLSLASSFASISEQTVQIHQHQWASAQTTAIAELILACVQRA